MMNLCRSLNPDFDLSPGLISQVSKLRGGGGEGEGVQFEESRDDGGVGSGYKLNHVPMFFEI